MCGLDLKHPCCTPGELVRNYYREQGRIAERQFLINEIENYCDTEHAWSDHCDCWMYIKILKDTK